MIADVKLALQKDGFILQLSIRASVRMSAHTNVNFCIKVLREVFFLLRIFFFKSFLSSRLLKFD